MCFLLDTRHVRAECILAKSSATLYNSQDNILVAAFFIYHFIADLFLAFFRSFCTYRNTYIPLAISINYTIYYPGQLLVFHAFISTVAK